MAAIMLERKKPGEQGPGWNGQQQGDPIGVGSHEEHGGNKDEKRSRGRHQLDDSTPVVGISVEVAMGGQAFGLQPQFRRKLRFIQNIQVGPQCFFKSEPSTTGNESSRL